MTSSARAVWRDVVCWALLGLIACWFSWGVLWHRAQQGEGSPSYDIYAYFYPNVLYALRALNDGHGLLWNSLQNCGQPFFANPQTALLYPPNWIFLFMNVEAGLLLLPVLHLSIGALGTYGLCRELGLHRSSALAGAIAFELGGNSLGLAAWMPNISGAYAWMPVAVLALERLLRVGTLSSSVLLGSTLTIQLLAGYPQVVFFTYQILLARIVWTIAAEPARRKTVALAALGMFVAPLLAAVHLIPGAELAGQSVRSAALATSESEIMTVKWQSFRALLQARETGPGTTFSIVACALAGAALFRSRRHGASLCYALLFFLFVTISFDNVLSQAYRTLPMSTTFRGLDRFLWPAGFCFSVLVAFGVERVRMVERNRAPTVMWPGIGIVVGIALYYWLVAGAVHPWEWALVLAMAFILLAIVTSTRMLQVACGVSMVSILTVNMLAVAGNPSHGMLEDAPAELSRNAAIFALIRERLTNQDRIAAIGENWDYSLMRKSPSVFGTPGVADYEPLTSRLYAEYYVKMMYGAANELFMENINQFYYLTSAVPRNLPLLNLVAARFLGVALVPTAEPPNPSRFTLLRQFGSTGLYENATALPRAFFVPSVQVVPERRSILRMLSSRTFPVRQLALLTETPIDGFHGAPGSIGSAEIVSDRSEELTLRVQSTDGGFVFVSDQYYPGWKATVNGNAMPVLNANYAFRLVRVPPGTSMVVFRYEPLSVRLGAWITIVTVLALCAAMLATLLRRRRVASSPG